VKRVSWGLFGRHFSNEERGKFFRPDAKFNLPIYLEKEVLEFFSQRVEAKGVDLNVLLNDLLKKDIAFVKAVE
jgi:hypothetical protein